MYVKKLKIRVLSKHVGTPSLLETVALTLVDKKPKRGVYKPALHVHIQDSRGYQSIERPLDWHSGHWQKSQQ